MKISLWIATVVVISGCSTQSPPNRWQYQSTNSYKNFERYYLEHKTTLSAMEFERARNYATQSADLRTLARLELSRCALKFALLEPYVCAEFEKVAPLVDDPELRAYHAFLQGDVSPQTLTALPVQYRKIAAALGENDRAELNRRVLEIEPLTSRMIAAAKVKESLEEETIEKILDDLSYHGYKHGVIVWLDFWIKRTQSEEKRSELRHKRDILLPPR
jgi:hypothetical protein